MQENRALHDKDRTNSQSIKSMEQKIRELEYTNNQNIKLAE